MDETSIVVMVLTALFGVLVSSVIYAKKYFMLKKALRDIVDAMEDDAITKEEFVSIVLTIKKIFY